MTNFPIVQDAKEQIVEIGRRMFERGYVAANDGNISCRIANDEILTTPTGVSKGYMRPEMIVRVKLDGSVVGDGKWKPSSEVKMHLRVYAENPETMAVTHAHPPISTAFSVAGICLDLPILTETVMSLGNVPVAKYATPGTEEVPDSVAPFCKDYNAVLLANHGALTWGDTLMQAYYRLESLEHYATILMVTQNIIGKYNCLSSGQVQSLLEIRKSLGIRSGGVPQCAVEPTNDRDVLPLSDSKE